MHNRKIYLTIILTGGFVALVVIIIVFLRLLSPSTPPSEETPPPPLQITSTTPTNGATDVYPGEIEISFTTNRPITSSDEYSLTFSPQLIYDPEITTVFPSSTVTYQILGALEQNTTYSITIDVTDGNDYQWSFTTSGQTPESSSGLIRQEEEELNENYYPLFDYIPYNTQSFSIDYTDRLTLEVRIVDNTREGVQEEVERWIREKGVDPSSHTIHYLVTNPS